MKTFVPILEYDVEGEHAEILRHARGSVVLVSDASSPHRLPARSG